jgi:ribosomal protein S18 acetylase RimI-like enzyme
MQSIIASIGNSSCFATTRENNDAMRHLLNKYGFSVTGEKYKSDNGEYSLVLYAYKP